MSACPRGLTRLVFGLMIGGMLLPADLARAQTRDLPIKYVYAIDYPVGRKAEYLAWVRSIGPTLQAPPELRRLRSYDNTFGASPQRVIEFEFDSLPAAAAYFARRDVQPLLDEIVNRGINSSVAVLSLRGDYAPRPYRNNAIKYVFRIDYPIGQRDRYLAWVAENAQALQSAMGVERLQSYDNYFGTSPHRVVEFEFASLDAAAGYFSEPDVVRVLDDLVNYGTNVAVWTLRLRSDYSGGTD